MGKLNVIIQDDVDQRFREEVFKRKGMKKGNLTEALEEAMTLWTTRPTVEKLKAQATNGSLLVSEREEATNLLGQMGDGAIDALIDVSQCTRLLVSERNNARKVLKGIMDKKRTMPTI